LGLLIDTSALAAVERRGSDFATFLHALGDEPVAIPSIVLGELLAGAELAGGARWRSSVRLAR
jgi:predicted nucleic acid-binding protein